MESVKLEQPYKIRVTHSDGTHTNISGVYFLGQDNNGFWYYQKYFLDINYLYDIKKIEVLRDKVDYWVE